MLFNLYAVDSGKAYPIAVNMNVKQMKEHAEFASRMVDLLINDSTAVAVELDYGDGSGHRLTCREE